MLILPKIYTWPIILLTYNEYDNFDNFITSKWGDLLILKKNEVDSTVFMTLNVDFEHYWLRLFDFDFQLC